MLGNTLADFRTLKSSAKYADASQITIDFHRVLPSRFRNAIVVSAQNATPVHANWWQCILTAAAHYRAQIFVIPLRYKNPTSVWTKSQDNDEHWADEVQPYLWSRRLDFNSNLKLFGDIPTQPTDTMPLSGVDQMSGPQSSIYGHVKLHSLNIPVPSGRMPKLITTTGACTQENYSLTKRGKIAEFHHSLSALLVELRGEDQFHIRQLHYSKTHNSATDGLKGNTFHPNGMVTKAPRPLNLGCGDIHVDFIDPKVWTATAKILDRLQPESVILPDLLDSYAINHHTRNDLVAQYAKHMAGRRDMNAETLRAIGWTVGNANRWDETEWVVQASNHNDMLRRWVLDRLRMGFGEDVHNMSFGVKTADFMLDNAKFVEGKGVSYPDPLHYWFRQQPNLPENLRLLDLDEPYMKGGIALHLHGDLGANGARGAAKAFAQMGDKSNTFHRHTDYIYQGNYGAGTSTGLKAEYNHGLSSWTQAHVLTQWDAKRQIIRFIDGYCNN